MKERKEEIIFFQKGTLYKTRAGLAHAELWQERNKERKKERKKETFFLQGNTL